MEPELVEVAEQVRPTSWAEERVLPVLSTLAGLLPQRGLRRGSTVTVSSPRGAGGATSLAVALIAESSIEGAWCAVVGVPSLGLVAAAELGVHLERLVLVGRPGSQWTTVVASMLDAVDVVVVLPPGGVSHTVARRLSARARSRGAVLVAIRGWPETPDFQLEVLGCEWQGLGEAHGHLRSRLVQVAARGRRAASRQSVAWLWLPSAGGPAEACDLGTDEPSRRRGLPVGTRIAEDDRPSITGTG